MGVTTVLAYPRPRVGLAFVGAGRVLPGHKPGPGEVTEGNLVTLAAAVEGAGATATSLGIWLLEARGVKAAITRHTRLLDLLVVSGGVSPPGSNFLAECLEEAGGKILIPEILVTPGRACLVATVGRCLVVALPGDPRGTLVGLHLLVLAAIHRMSGWREPYIQWDEARLASPVRNCSDLPRLLPGRIQAAAGGGFAVIPEHERKLGSLLGVAGMNGFILLPPGSPNQVAGARVKIARFCR